MSGNHQGEMFGNAKVMGASIRASVLVLVGYNNPEECIETITSIKALG